MAYVWQRWLAAEFRTAGLKVIEVDGWENRGRPASTGHFDPRGPVTVHHTGATTSASEPGPTLRTLIVGRSDLPGPLCQFSVRHDGVVVVVAAGRSNHAGRIGKSGVVGMPLGADGNALALGDEVDTNGTQALPEAQRRSIAVTNRVCVEHAGRPATWIHRHQDISGTGKWDLGSLTTAQLRDDAKQIDQEDDMPNYSDWKREDKEALAADVADAVRRELHGGEQSRFQRLVKRLRDTAKSERQRDRKVADRLDALADEAEKG